MNAKQRQLRHADYVEHIVEAAHLARSYVAGISKETFLEDSKTQDAVILKILVIGEAAAQVLDEHSTYAQTRTDIPWHQMKGMRNRMVHGYFETNLELVWETVAVFLPELERKLRQAPD
ncbi:MAG: DUF86 domain-containing protein [Burkholderiales bacterium]|nr:DUF86 domain-containing protein [Burkholderiales bacterium]